MNQYLDPKIFKKAPDWKNCPGQARVYCPVCKEAMYESGCKIHITNSGKHEIVRLALEKLNLKIKTPHFDFWLKHTMKLRGKRAWMI